MGFKVLLLCAHHQHFRLCLMVLMVHVLVFTKNMRSQHEIRNNYGSQIEF